MPATQPPASKPASPLVDAGSINKRARTASQPPLHYSAVCLFEGVGVPAEGPKFRSALSCMPFLEQACFCSKSKSGAQRPHEAAQPNQQLSVAFSRSSQKHDIFSWHSTAHCYVIFMWCKLLPKATLYLGSESHNLAHRSRYLRSTPGPERSGIISCEHGLSVRAPGTYHNRLILWSLKFQSINIFDKVNI